MTPSKAARDVGEERVALLYRPKTLRVIRMQLAVAESLLRACRAQKCRPHKGRLLPHALWKSIDHYLARSEHLAASGLGEPIGIDRPHPSEDPARVLAAASVLQTEFSVLLGIMGNAALIHKRCLAVAQAALAAVEGVV